MKITIHRGSDQIGGCVTEYEHDGYRLFVDYGEQLPGSKKTTTLEVEGLTRGDLSKSALLITHYHGDHIGCIKYLSKELPIYIGKLGRDIQLTLSDHISRVDKKQDIIIERLKAATCFLPGRPFKFGPFKVMPVTVDHSAFDAYAFKIEADGVSAFHTGDFRTHGFRSGKLEEVLNKYVGKVDYVVCEGTNVSRPDSTTLSESQLQKLFEKNLQQKIGHIVYMSSTNIDRLFAMYHAALKAGILFLVDTYQREIMDTVVNSKSLWSNARLYQYGEYEPEVLKSNSRGKLCYNDNIKEKISQSGYVLIARPKPKFDELIKELPGKKVKYLSMWKGYLDKNSEAYNEALANALADGYEYLHTSGHCDMNSLRGFFRLLQPKAIIPIHTDNPEAFVKLFSDEWSVIRLHDGDSFEATA